MIIVFVCQTVQCKVCLAGGRFEVVRLAVIATHQLQLYFERIKRNQKPTLNPTRNNFVHRMQRLRIVLDVFTVQINLKPA